MSSSQSRPDAAQHLAAQPYHSAWVAASAGSGKTKVLTDRVLNLLLEGCAPERLLCLTFTKAAAAEMAKRLHTRLGEWAILPEDDLKNSLATLCGRQVTPEKMAIARQLFTLTLDTPGGLKIQTIHSFCQSLLKQFPLEAGLSPFFKVMDETEQRALIQQTFFTVLDSPLFTDLTLRFSETSFEDFNEFILQKRESFSILTPSSAPPAPAPSFEIPEALLKNLPLLLQEGSPKDQERGEILAHFLALSCEERKKRPDPYLSLFLTQQGEKRAHLVTSKLASLYPHLKEALNQEADRLVAWKEAQKIYDVSHMSQLLSTYALTFLKTYEKLKKTHSLLDYEDLILKSVALLKNPGCHWVLYKLDGGLDHILLDEAQDTSPSQWQIIRTIAEEFYANAAADPRNRTLFIVGDQKQSIYSFQGADPQVFSEMQCDLRQFAKSSEKAWKDIDLNVSFRSTPEILHLVNTVFPSFPHHLPFRKEAPGHVEIWPLLTKEESPPLEPWQFTSHPTLESPQKRLALEIAKTLKRWMEGHSSPLTRPINPGDILILVRRRTTFAETMIRTLKEQNIPVAGVDRLMLLTSLGVQDLLKIGEFLLLPDDDLTLATVLKGPLFTLSEENLFDLSYDRGSLSLWQRLLENNKFEEVTAILKDLLAQVDFLTPFSLYSYILGPLEGRKRWQASLGLDVLDFLDEFLNLCLLFQEEHPPSLQTFLHWISQEDIELKRDFDQSNHVRVMTVHGAKGQQAPIVFLPDTTQPPLDLPPFGFHEGSLVWLPPAEKDTPLTQAVKEKLRHQQNEEYWRLLYVALTRAEDALYICGWEGKKDDTWYSRVLSAMKDIGTSCETGWILSSQHSTPSSPPQKQEKPEITLPQWTQTAPPQELPPPLLRPSQGLEAETMRPSPFGSFGQQRGILIHKLLEILPSLPEDRRHGLALSYLRKEGVEDSLALEMMARVEEVLKAYPELFEPQTYSELPFMGYMKDKLVSGQIDKLLVTKDSLFIVDFKTHASPPRTLEETPKAYLSQMAIYHAVLAKIYPTKTITTGLLWTEIPRLDVLPMSLLSPYVSWVQEDEDSSPQSRYG